MKGRHHHPLLLGQLLAQGSLLDGLGIQAFRRQEHHRKVRGFRRVHVLLPDALGLHLQRLHKGLFAISTAAGSPSSWACTSAR